jgi:hypothetical protein
MITSHRRGLRRTATNKARAGGHQLRQWRGLEHVSVSQCETCGGVVVADDRDGSIQGAAASPSCEAWITRAKELGITPYEFSAHPARKTRTSRRKGNASA